MKFHPAILAVSVMLCAGCATTQPTYQYTKKSNSATIEASLPNVFKLMAGRTAAINFVEVDGVLVKKELLTGHTRKLDVAPGLHNITVEFKSGSLELSSGQFTTDLEVKPGAHYLFTADVVGMDYDLSIWEITDAKDAKVLVKKDRTAIRKTDRLQVFPITVPR